MQDGFNKSEPDLHLSTEKTNVIVASTDRDRYIGLEGALPWGRKLRGDLAFLARMIRCQPNIALIIGRKTFESLPSTLKRSLRILVLSRNENYAPPYESTLRFASYADAVEHCTANGLVRVVLGGSPVYAEAFRGRCRIFHTVVEQGALGGDVALPEYAPVAPPKNISEAVHRCLVANDVPKTWAYGNGAFFENGLTYRFFLVEK